MNERELDDKIRRALESRGAEDIDPEQYDTLFGLTRSLLESRWRGWFLLTYFCAFLTFGLEVYCAVRFFGASETYGWILWSTAFLWCTAAFLMMKVWIWMQMDKNSVKLEIKRLQLLVAEALESRDPK